MDKVNELLRQAWNEAIGQGVVLNNVDFHVMEHVGGKHNLLNVTFDAKLTKENKNETIRRTTAAD